MNVVNLSYNSTNCYLVPAGDGWLMIDTGWPDTFSQMLQLLYHNNISVNEIDYLLLTHLHPDHAGLTQNLRDLGINLILHENQVPYINKLNLQFKKNPKANFRDIVANNYTMVNDQTSRSFLHSIGVEGVLISTPGHSEDSVSLILDNHAAFVGDLPAYTLAGSQEDELVKKSWETVRSLQTKTIYPGHGDSYPID